MFTCGPVYKKTTGYMTRGNSPTTKRSQRGLIHVADLLADVLPPEAELPDTPPVEPATEALALIKRMEEHALSVSEAKPQTPLTGEIPYPQEDICQLNLWPESERGSPNAFLRSALLRQSKARTDSKSRRSRLSVAIHRSLFRSLPNAASASLTKANSSTSMTLTCGFRRSTRRRHSPLEPSVFFADMRFSKTSDALAAMARP
jgi:hypothetical protein